MAPRWLVRCVAASVALAACAPEPERAEPTLAPLVDPVTAPVETAATTTTIAPSSDPTRPLVAALPEGECALGSPVPGGEITFAVGERLYGVAPDGSGARCLLTLREDQRGRVQWSPRGDRVLLRSATVVDAAGVRGSGYLEDNERVRWQPPGGDLLIAPTASSRTLVRRSSSSADTRTEVTFLAVTDLAVYHPSGAAMIGAGTFLDGGRGIALADGDGAAPRPVVLAPERTVVPELAPDAGGAALWFVADTGTSFRVHQLRFEDLAVSEVSSEQAPISALTAGPVAGTVAWAVGLCNSTTTARVRDERSGTVVDVGPGTPLEGRSVAPLGWLDGARVVVTARPLGCEGPADVWIWNLLDGAATLVASNVEVPQLRTVAEPVAPLAVAPELPPAQL